MTSSHALLAPHPGRTGEGGEPVRHADVVGQPGRDPGVAQGRRVPGAVVADRVQVGRLDQRRGEPLEPAEQRREEGVAHVAVGTRVVGEVGVHRPAGEDPALGVLGDGRGRHREVDRGVDERLVPQRGDPGIAQDLRDDRGEVAPGGVTGHRHPPGVGAEHVPGDLHPRRGVDAVQGRHGRPVLGGQAVVDGDDDAPDLGREERAQRVVVDEVAEDPAAAVEPHDDRHVGARVGQRAGAVDPQRDLVVVAGRRRAVGDPDGRVHPPGDESRRGGSGAAGGSGPAGSRRGRGAPPGSAGGR